MKASDYALLARARDYAAHKHRKHQYGGLPYTTHLDEVVSILIECGYGSDIEMLIAALLHDVVEDCADTMEAKMALLAEIAREFGQRVADLVWAVTGIGDGRDECNAAIKAKLIAYPGAAPLKTADRTANLRAAMRERIAFHARRYLHERQAFDPAVVGAISQPLHTALMNAYAGAHKLVAADNDDKAVDAFAASLKLKLARGRAKGRSGWDDPLLTPQLSLAEGLQEHVDKGDALDVGLYAMFLHHHNWATYPLEPSDDADFNETYQKAA